MSYKIGIDTISLRPTPRVAHTEFVSSERLVRRVCETTGLNFFDAWEYDFIWAIHDGPIPWGRRGRVTDMGHAEFLEGGVDRRQPQPCPFRDVSAALRFDAVEEYGLQPDSGELVAFYENVYQTNQNGAPDQVFTGGYYNTMMSGAIQTFGWDMLLTAAADLGAFEDVLDSFYRLTRYYVEAWAKTSIEVFVCHDDIVWTSGAFLDPAFYRGVIFPRYRELWDILHAAGKKVLFYSDGDWTVFLEDIIAAGADGLGFEPLVSLDTVVALCGKTHWFLGSKVDCRTLTFGTEDQIKAEVDASLECAGDCPGFMFAVGNQIPSNVPVEKARFYLEYLRSRWERRGKSCGGAPPRNEKE